MTNSCFPPSPVHCTLGTGAGKNGDDSFCLNSGAVEKPPRPYQPFRQNLDIVITNNSNLTLCDVLSDCFDFLKVSGKGAGIFPDDSSGCNK